MRRQRWRRDSDLSITDAGGTLTQNLADLEETDEITAAATALQLQINLINAFSPGR